MIASKLAQVTEAQFEQKNVNIVDNAANYLMQSRDLALQMRKLDLKSHHIHALRDALFAANHDDTSQFG